MTSPLDGAGSGVYVEESILDVYILALPYVETESKPSNPDAASVQSSARRSDDRRHERVATAPYYLAESRFRTGAGGRELVARGIANRRGRCGQEILSV